MGTFPHISHRRAIVASCFPQIFSIFKNYSLSCEHDLGISNIPNFKGEGKRNFAEGARKKLDPLSKKL
jgi:hypothetical protein